MKRNETFVSLDMAKIFGTAALLHNWSLFRHICVHSNIKTNDEEIFCSNVDGRQRERGNSTNRLYGHICVFESCEERTI